MLRRLLAIALLVTSTVAYPGEAPSGSAAPAVPAEAQGRSAEPALAANLIEQERREHQEQMFLDRWIIALTSVLGLIAFLQLLGFITQAVYMRKTFSAAEDAAHRGLRAYLDFPDAFVQRLGDGRFQVEIQVANSGRTRALAVTKWLKTALLDRSQSCVFDEGKFDRIQRAIAPQCRWHLREDHAWPDAAAAAIEGAEKTVYVWGQVRYTDIYGEPHMSSFRFRSQAMKYANGTITGWVLEPDEEGNDLS